MSEQLILQELLLSDKQWKVHNCKLSQAMCDSDTAITLLEHYNGLPDELQNAHSLTFEQLRHLNDKMSVAEVAQFLNIPAQHFKKYFQIKYIGRAVIFCENPQIAIRFNFSNTAKPAQTVFLPKAQAIAEQAVAWRAFGVVDVLYKEQNKMVSLDKDGDEFIISANPNYQPLPSQQSLAVSYLLNEIRGEFGYINERIEQVVNGELQ